VEEKEPLEINLTITNKDVVAKNVVLYGANFFKGLPPLITVVPAFGVDYTQVLRDSATHPFTVGMIRMYSTTTVAQVQQSMSIVSTNIYGEERIEPMPMEDEVSEYQYQPGIARTTKQFDITGNVGFRLGMLPLTRVICTVSVKKIIRMPTRFDSRTIRSYPIHEVSKQIIL